MVAVSFYWWNRKPRCFNNRFHNSQSTCTSILNLIFCCRWSAAESDLRSQYTAGSAVTRDSFFFCLEIYFFKLP
jgi:hypothetical protein